MISAQRQKKIVDKIKTGMPISVSELSQEFKVSVMTVRRDLAMLEKEGALTRTHGGAVPVCEGEEEPSFEPSFAEKMNRFATEKLAIAVKANELIHDGDTILLGAGTTATALATILKSRQNITVVTNTVNIAMELAQNAGINLVMTGGNIRTKSYALVGALTERVLSELHVQKAFLSVNGISLEQGLTTPNISEAYTNSLMIKAAEQLIVMADHSKLGRVTLSRFASIAEMNALITDSGAPQEFLSKLAQQGVEILVGEDKP
jgi:DeoR/GlpR family transcriptional regulator of sugar metabolism